jgi:hypothetical protein
MPDSPYLSVIHIGGFRFIDFHPITRFHLMEHFCLVTHLKLRFLEAFWIRYELSRVPGLKTKASVGQTTQTKRSTIASKIRVTEFPANETRYDDKTTSHMTRLFYLHTYRTDQFIKLTACLQLGFPTSAVRNTECSSQHQT